MTKRPKRPSPPDRTGAELADAYLRHEEMNEASDYLARGRRLAGLTDVQARDGWVTAFRRWFAGRTRDSSRNMDDHAAELRLRGIEIPTQEIEQEAEQLRAEIQEIGPEAPSEELSQRISRFLRERKRPN